MVAGCKCPGSCACKIKKPRKPKVKKAVLGGRVKQPQVVIQGMPAVSTTAIPAGYPTINVTSDADYTKPFKTKEKAKSKSTQTETQTQAEVKEEPVRRFKPGLLASGSGRGPEIRVEPAIGFMPGMLASGKGRGPEIGEGVSELKGDSLFLSLPTKTPSQQLSLLKSKIAAGTTKQFPVLRATTGTQAGPSLTTTEVQTEAPSRMTTAAQTNLVELVGVGTQAGPSVVTGGTQTSMKVRSPEEIAAIAKEQKEAGMVEGYRQGRAREAALRTKETKEMGTETEPLLVTVAKGLKRDVFSLMKEQEATGKIVSLTGAGRPARPFNASIDLASPSPPPAPAPAPAAPAPAPVEPRRTTDFESSMKSFFQKKPASAPAVRADVGSSSSSSGVPGYTVITRPSAGLVTDPKTGLKYSYSYPGGKVVQMPPVPEVIDLS